jgi:hypothetical protein
MNCGECLINSVKIVPLLLDGTCPECGTKYPAMKLGAAHPARLVKTTGRTKVEIASLCKGVVKAVEDAKKHLGKYPQYADHWKASAWIPCRLLKRVVHEETGRVFFEKGDITVYTREKGMVVAYSPRIHDEVIVEANEVEEI